MAITQTTLYSRYMQASEALEEHAVKVAEKLSGGNSDKQLIHKYNLMSSWMDYIKDFISVSIVVEGATPGSLIMPKITGPFITDPATLAYIGACIVLGIRDNEGTYITIGRVNRANEATWKLLEEKGYDLRGVRDKDRLAADYRLGRLQETDKGLWYENKFLRNT